MDLQDILVFLSCYILGSLPFSVWIGRAFFKTDVRHHGSGNPGATNMLRTLGPRPALFVLSLDILKGVIAVLIARFCSDLEIWGIMDTGPIGGFLAVLGHMFSSFLRFTGGKGVATLVGVICVVYPWTALSLLPLFLIILLLSKYVSLASVVTVTVYAICVIIFAYTRELSLNYSFITQSVIAIIMATLVVYKHRANIHRLRMGTENKFTIRKTGMENK